jgi:hypothetical protein
MFSSTAYVIRKASEADASDVWRVSLLDSQRPLEGPALVGEIDGKVAAAISLDTGRVVADPFRPTAELVTHLRMRASGILAADRRPRLRDRIRAGIRTSESVHRSPRSAWPRRTPLSQIGG